MSPVLSVRVSFVLSIGCPKQLEAIGVATRRAILRRLVRAPCSVAGTACDRLANRPSIRPVHVWEASVSLDVSENRWRFPDSPADPSRESDEPGALAKECLAVTVEGERREELRQADRRNQTSTARRQ